MVCKLVRFDLKTGKLDPLSVDSLARTEAVGFSQDGTRLYGVAEGKVITWDVATAREIEQRTVIAGEIRHRGLLRCLHVSDDGRETIWNSLGAVHAVRDGKQVGEFNASNYQRYTTFDLTADHRQIVHDAYYGELKHGDLWQGTTIRELLPRAKVREGYRIAIAPNNRTLAVMHRSHATLKEKYAVEIELWDLQQGRKVGGLSPVGIMPRRMEFSRDSRELRVFHEEEMSVWDIPSRALVRARKIGLSAT